MRVYYSSNESEWSRETGTHYGGKIKLSRPEYNKLCRRAGVENFGYLGDPYRNNGREFRFTKIPGGLELCRLLNINYRACNYCIEIF